MPVLQHARITMAETSLLATQPPLPEQPALGLLALPMKTLPPRIFDLRKKLDASR